MGKEKEKETEKPKGSFIPIEWFFKKGKRREQMRCLCCVQVGNCTSRGQSQ